jgi:hypothetical protein
MEMVADKDENVHLKEMGCPWPDTDGDGVLEKMINVHK